jgi:hypothetical protein
MILRFLVFGMAILFLSQSILRTVDRGRGEDAAVQSLVSAQRAYHQAAMDYVEANPTYLGTVPVALPALGGSTISGPFALRSQAFSGGLVLTWFTAPPEWVPAQRLAEELRRLGPGVGIMRAGNVQMQIRDRATGVLQTSVVTVTVGAAIADNTPVLFNRI